MEREEITALVEKKLEPVWGCLDDLMPEILEIKEELEKLKSR